MKQHESAMRSPKELAELTGKKKYLHDYALSESENILKDTWWMINAIKAYRDNTDFIVKDMNVVLSHALALGNKDIIQLALWSGGQLNSSSKHTKLGFKIPDNWRTSADLNDLPKSEEDEILHAALYFDDRLKDVLQDGTVSQEEANELIDLAIYTNTPKYFDLAMNFNPNLNAVDEMGKTLLHHCNDNSIFTKKLLQNGANPNIQDMYGRTPLMYAMLNGDRDVVETLIRNGADVSIRDENGETAEAYIKSADLLFAYQRLTSEDKKENNKVVEKPTLTLGLKDVAECYNDETQNISNTQQIDKNTTR